MADDRLALTDEDRNHIEARLQIGVASGRQVPLGGAHDLALLARANRLGRGTEDRAAPGFDLDEQQMPAVTGNNVKLPDRGAVVTGDDAETTLHQETGGGLLTEFAKLQSRFGHGWPQCSRTPPKVRRWHGEGPSRAIAWRWAALP